MYAWVPGFSVKGIMISDIRCKGAIWVKSAELFLIH